MKNSVINSMLIGLLFLMVFACEKDQYEPIRGSTEYAVEGRYLPYCNEEVVIAPGNLSVIQIGNPSVTEILGGDLKAVRFRARNSAMPLGLLLTDMENKILQVSTTNRLNLGDLMASETNAFKIWGFTYKGAVQAEPGQDAATAELASYCYQLTSNYIKVIKVIRDKRDNRVYQIANIDGKYWMAENLNYEAPMSVWYNNDPALGETYGRLYTDRAAKRACPDGWRLPSNREWTDLAEYAGGYAYIEIRSWGPDLVEVGDPWLGYATLIESGESDFNALLAGWGKMKGDKYNDRFGELGEATYFWTGTAGNVMDKRVEPAADPGTYYFGFHGKDNYLYREVETDNYMFSCRCVKD